MNPTIPPPLWQRAWNLTQAVAAYVSDGCQSVTPDEYRNRLTICQSCPERSDNMCLKCGCYLPIKATVRAAECPLARWPPPQAGQGTPTQIPRLETAVQAESDFADPEMEMLTEVPPRYMKQMK